MLLASMCRTMPFLAHALKKTFSLTLIIIVVKNKLKCGLSWSVLLSTTSTHHYSFPEQFFSYCFCVLSKFAKVFDRKV